MKDKLQRFVRDNREAFDVHEPSDELWNRLSEKLPKASEIVSEDTDKNSSGDKDNAKPIGGDNFQAAIVHESFQNGRTYNPFFLPKPEGGGGVFDKQSEKPSSLEKLERDGTSKNKSFQWNWRIAASIALVVGLGWVGYRINQNYGITEAPEVALADPGFAKQVSQYTHLIDNKRAELRQMTESDPALYKEFAVELDQLERSYQNLKSDLPKNPNQEVVIQAMIQNLQWQIDLLNQQLDIIQRIKNKNNNHANDKLS